MAKKQAQAAKEPKVIERNENGFTALEQKMIDGVREEMGDEVVKMSDREIFDAAQPAFTAKTAIKHVKRSFRRAAKPAAVETGAEA